MKQSIKGWMGIAAVVVASLGVGRGYNMAWNNRETTTSGRHTISYATGLFGHNEYTQYADGSVDLKIYPPFLGHRYAASVFYQDLNGDGLVDRIRVNGSELEANQVRHSLVRNIDYETNKTDFDKADNLLTAEKQKHETKQQPQF